MMGILLIGLPFLLLVDWLWRFDDRPRPLREAIVVSGVVFGGLLAVSTEVLGYFRLITPLIVAGFWVLVFFTILYLRMTWRPARKASVFRFFSDSATDERVLLSLTLATIVVTGVIAFIAPPNTWDSMTYHLSRVMHWIQNRSVYHYPTGIDRQLYVNPFAEYGIMHFQLLTGGDRFANFVQWFSYIGCVLGVSLIAKWLGSAWKGQVMAMAAAVSIPMAIMQSTSTQTDLVVAFWGVCFVLFFLKWRDTRDDRDWLLFSVGAGLLALTKTTGVFVMAPFGIWALVNGFRRGSKRMLALLCASVMIVTLLCGPFLARNYRLYGHPLGAMDTVEKTNHLDTGFKTAVSSVLLNVGLHLGTPYDTVNRYIERGFRAAHDSLGIPMNKAFRVMMSTSEDHAGNFMHIVFFGGVLLSLLWRRGNSLPLLYASLLLAGIVLQSVVFGWSPWRSRYHTIFFVLAAPFIAHGINQARSKRACRILIMVLVLSSIPWLTGNDSKPLFSQGSIFKRPRILQYFVRQMYLFGPYVSATEVVREPFVRQIGLMMGEDSWEYPFWVLLDPIGNNIRMEHILIRGSYPNSHQAHKGFMPDAILASTPAALPDRLVYGGASFQRVMRDRGVAVFMREDRRTINAVTEESITTAVEN